MPTVLDEQVEVWSGWMNMPGTVGASRDPGEAGYPRRLVVRGGQGKQVSGMSSALSSLGGERMVQCWIAVNELRPISFGTMEEHHHETIAHQDLSGQDLRGRRYEDCLFDHCDLSKADLGKAHLLRCTFVDCDLSMVKLVGASLQEIEFRGCRLLGLDLTVCKSMLFSARFMDCRLDHALLSGPSLKGLRFERCSMNGADLTGADLREAMLDRCALQDAVFRQCDLRGADLSTAYGFCIDPEENRLEGARFSVPGALSLLGKYGVVVV